MPAEVPARSDWATFGNTPKCAQMSLATSAWPTMSGASNRQSLPTPTVGHGVTTHVSVTEMDGIDHDADADHVAFRKEDTKP